MNIKVSLYYFNDYHVEDIKNYLKTINIIYNLNISFIFYNYDNIFNSKWSDLVLYNTDIFNNAGCSDNAFKVYNYLKNRSFYNNQNEKCIYILDSFPEGHGYPMGNTDEILNVWTYYESNKSYSITPYNNSEFNINEQYGFGMINSLYKYYENGKQNHFVKKKNFCSMVSSHSTPERVSFFDYISEHYKKIRSFGSCKKNMGNVIYYVDKVLKKIMPTYKFNICFENTRSYDKEAYITEKIYNAFMWGTVPIYWGNNKQIYDIFNKDSFINLTDKTLEESLEIIKEYDNNDELYYNMLNTYPFKEAFNHNNFLNDFNQKKKHFFYKILKRIIKEKQCN